MGLSSGSTSTTQNVTQTPTVPSWIQQPYQDLTSKISSAGLTDPSSLATPQNSNQTQAFARAAQPDPGIPGITAASTYKPDTVTAGSLATTDLTPYLNPFTTDVVNSSLGDLERSRQTQIADDQGAATLSGAFGGSRHGIVDTTTDDNYSRTAASTAASLRQAAFTAATGLASTDIGNKLQADTTNASNGLTGANLNLQASQALSQVNRDDITQLATMGEAERSIAVANNPALLQLQQLGILDQLLAQVPTGAFSGQTSTGTSTGTSTPSLIDDIATLGKTASSFFTPGK